MADINLLTETERKNMISKYATIFNFDFEEAQRRINAIII
jgi:hypothetical protein